MVAAASIAGTIFGWAIGELLAWISGDYVVHVREYVSLGLRGGFLAGTVLAAVHAKASEPAGARGEGLLAVLVLGLVAAGGVGVAAVVGLLLPFTQVATPWEQHLGHPRRHLVFLAIHWSWLYAMLLGTVAACSSIWHRRRAADAVRKRQPEKEIYRE